MIKILSSEQMKSLDAATIEREPVSSLDLMERASREFVTWFTERFNALKKVGVVCGSGNNGGDGLAIARMLKDWGYPVKVWIVKGPVKSSPDFTANLERASTLIELAEISSKADLGLFHDRDVIIDALFGYGLSRPLEGIYAQVVECINATSAIRVAIDMPSGLMADRPSSRPIVMADYTVTFHLPKLSLFFPQHYRYTGEWQVLNISLDREFIRDVATPFLWTNAKGIKKLFMERSRFDHKGTYGHSMLVSGSHGKIGACVLAARAALRSGTGLLTLYVPGCGYSIVQNSVPEAMAIVDPGESFITECPDVSKATVLGIGPGLGQDPGTMKMLATTLEKFGKPVVLDADALNIISTKREILHLIPAGSVLTPHPREFERLVGEWRDDFERLEKQRKLAGQLASVVVLKGAYTSIACPDGRVYFNSTGNPGMATGGTGDVLTGVITGLIARGYRNVEAAVLGVYLHGLSGDLAVLEKGMESLIASDLVEFLPSAFRQIDR